MGYDSRTGGRLSGFGGANVSRFERWLLVSSPRDWLAGTEFSRVSNCDAVKDVFLGNYTPLIYRKFLYDISPSRLEYKQGKKGTSKSSPPATISKKTIIERYPDKGNRQCCQKVIQGKKKPQISSIGPSYTPPSRTNKGETAKYRY